MQTECQCSTLAFLFFIWHPGLADICQRPYDVFLICRIKELAQAFCRMWTSCNRNYTKRLTEREREPERRVYMTWILRFSVLFRFYFSTSCQSQLRIIIFSFLYHIKHNIREMLLQSVVCVCVCVSIYVHTGISVCFNASHEFMIHPVSQWAVSFRMELHKRVMEIPGELLSCGLPAPSGMHYLGVLSLYAQSVCQRAHDFKGDLKLSFIFCLG